MKWFAIIVLVTLYGYKTSALPSAQTPQFIEDVQEREISNADESRIVSGWEADLGQHPHQIHMRMVNPSGTVNSCGGSIVHPQWVISAAHCTANRATLVIRAGVRNITLPSIILETTEYYNHPSYDDTRPGVVQPDEISIVKLPVALVFNDVIQPIRVQSAAEAYRNYDGEQLYASGFGRLWTAGDVPEIMNWVYLTGVTTESCNQIYGATVNQNTICARYFNVTSQSTCQGDSGGPLVHESEDGPVLVGVSSFVSAFGCHHENPAGFIRPGPFHYWFREVTGINLDITINT